MREKLASILHKLGIAVWNEITTEAPHCIYYFGPFSYFAEAKNNQAGFLEDIREEGAKITTVVIKRCNPKDLTIFD